eukprot:1154984-Pelagomonas_calceolata.AAC.3
MPDTQTSRLEKKRKNRQAEETLPTSIKERETHWLRRVVSLLHHKATKTGSKEFEKLPSDQQHVPENIIQNQQTLLPLTASTSSPGLKSSEPERVGVHRWQLPYPPWKASDRSRSLPP